MQLSENFNTISDNLICVHCGGFEYSNKFLRKLQLLRYLVDKPFRFSESGGGFYRCRDFNQKIGGAENSQHLLGNAADILTHGWDGATKWLFVSQAMQLDLSIGVYPSWFHIDNRGGDPVFF